jgi:hypothetical protein
LTCAALEAFSAAKTWGCRSTIFSSIVAATSSTPNQPRSEASRERKIT